MIPVPPFFSEPRFLSGLKYNLTLSFKLARHKQWRFRMCSPSFLLPLDVISGMARMELTDLQRFIQPVHQLGKSLPCLYVLVLEESTEKMFCYLVAGLKGIESTVFNLDLLVQVGSHSLM